MQHNNILKQYKNCINTNKIIPIKKGLHLYRSTLFDIDKDKDKFDNNNIPKPIYDDETDKSGVYFSVINPTLSEFMTLEYNKDMFLYTYQLTDNITVNCGKYSNPEISENHIDIEIEPISINYKIEELPPSYELFISEKDLNKIKFISKKFISVNDIKNKYKDKCLNISKKQYMNEIFNSTIYSYNKTYINNEILFNKKYKVISVNIYNIKDIDNLITYDIILTLYNIETNDYDLKILHNHFYPQ